MVGLFGWVFGYVEVFWVEFHHDFDSLRVCQARPFDPCYMSCHVRYVVRVGSCRAIGVVWCHVMMVSCPVAINCPFLTHRFFQSFLHPFSYSYYYASQIHADSLLFSLFLNHYINYIKFATNKKTWSSMSS